MNNRIKDWGIAIISSLFLNASCIEHRAEVKHSRKPDSSKQDEEKYIHDTDYKTFRIYEGNIPCEDCSGIEQRLVVKGDTLGIFRLTETYKNATEDGDATIVCSGQWKKVKQKNKEILVLSQGSLSDSVRRMEYDFHSKEIVQISLDDNRFKNTSEYHLRLVRQSK